MFTLTSHSIKKMKFISPFATMNVAILSKLMKSIA